MRFADLKAAADVQPAPVFILAVCDGLPVRIVTQDAVADIERVDREMLRERDALQALLEGRFTLILQALLAVKGIRTVDVLIVPFHLYSPCHDDKQQQSA